MRWTGNPLQNSVMVKDMRVRLRSRNTMVVMTLHLLVLGAVVIMFLVEQSDLTSARTLHAGVRLFQALAVVQLCLILVTIPISTAGAISEERHRGTWDLLMVTRLSAFDIIWGKFLANLTFNLLLVVAPLPFFASVFLFGGVTSNDVVHTYIVLLVTVLLLTVVSLFLSVITDPPTLSLIASGVVSLVLAFGLSIAVIALESWPQVTGLADLGVLGAFPSDAPPLTPLAQIDPLVALLSGLPSGNDTTVLGNLGLIQHAFGLPLRLPLWGVFGLLTLAITVLLLMLSTLLLRVGRPWLHGQAW